LSVEGLELPWKPRSNRPQPPRLSALRTWAGGMRSMAMSERYLWRPDIYWGLECYSRCLWSALTQPYIIPRAPRSSSGGLILLGALLDMQSRQGAVQPDIVKESAAYANLTVHFSIHVESVSNRFALTYNNDGVTRQNFVPMPSRPAAAAADSYQTDLGISIGRDCRTMTMSSLSGADETASTPPAPSP
ncbi:hypothetical protein THAOC_05558, partial [Thalassiosira oceanica]